MTNSTRNPQKKSVKTTAYLARFDANRDINAFWQNIKDISMHKNKIDQVDSKIRTERGMDDPPPTATVAQRGAEPAYVPDPRRGRGGIHNTMNGQTARNVSGSVLPEHNQTGQSMNYVMYGEQRDNRRCVSQQANQARFAKSSQMIGTQANLFGAEQKDPADCLAPQKNFRKASEASMGRLWQRDNDFDLYEQKQLTKHEMCKTRSRERYFQSSISTLPGPSTGVNVVKQRDDVKRDRSEADHI